MTVRQQTHNYQLRYVYTSSMRQGSYRRGKTELKDTFHISKNMRKIKDTFHISKDTHT